MIDTYRIAGGAIVMLERGREYVIKVGSGGATRVRYLGPSGIQHEDDPEERLEFRTMQGASSRFIMPRSIGAIRMAEEIGLARLRRVPFRKIR